MKPSQRLALRQSKLGSNALLTPPTKPRATRTFIACAVLCLAAVIGVLWVVGIFPFERKARRTQYDIMNPLSPAFVTASYYFECPFDVRIVPVVRITPGDGLHIFSNFEGKTADGQFTTLAFDERVLECDGVRVSYSAKYGARLSSPAFQNMGETDWRKLGVFNEGLQHQTVTIRKKGLALLQSHGGWRFSVHVGNGVDRISLSDRLTAMGFEGSGREGFKIDVLPIIVLTLKEQMKQLVPEAGLKQAGDSGDIKFLSFPDLAYSENNTEPATKLIYMTYQDVLNSRVETFLMILFTTLLGLGSAAGFERLIEIIRHKSQDSDA